MSYLGQHPKILSLSLSLSHNTLLPQSILVLQFHIICSQIQSRFGHKGGSLKTTFSIRYSYSCTSDLHSYESFLMRRDIFCSLLACIKYSKGKGEIFRSILQTFCFKRDCIKIFSRTIFPRINEPEKTAYISQCHLWFLCEMTSEKRAQKFETDKLSTPRSERFL